MTTGAVHTPPHRERVFIIRVPGSFLSQKTKRRTVHTADVLMSFFFLDAGRTLPLGVENEQGQF
jgi:hypothetical protein